MLNSLKLRTVLLLVSSLIMAYLCYFILDYSTIISDTSNLDEKWHSYQAHQNEKTRLRAELIEALGYGGLIHKYDNFILRKTTQHMIEAWVSYGIVQSVINKLILYSDSHGERTSLEDLRLVVDEIGENLKYVEDRIAAGVSSKNILSSVDIDFFKADRALDNLGKALSSDLGDNKETLKEDIVVRMNGFIQAYKRYLILGDELEYKLAKSHAAQSKQFAEQYLTKDISFGERIAIEDILETISEYENNLEAIKENLANDMLAEDVDRLVRVDDTEALRGLKILRAVNLELITEEASQVDSLIHTLKQTHLSFSYYQLGFLLLLILLVNYLSFKLAIKPIEKVTSAMVALSNGDLNVELEQDYHGDNEIGQMAHAFNVFKDHELQRRDAEHELRTLATTDHLTGLANRAQLENRFSELFSIARRNNDTIAALMLDLDNFKGINDKYGHESGDELLKDVAEVIHTEVREVDIAARLGGDEFAIILYAPKSKKDVEGLGNRIIERISRMNNLWDNNEKIGVSIGLVFDEASNIIDLKNLLKKADKGLYSAKENGKNRIVELSAGIFQAVNQ